MEPDNGDRDEAGGQREEKEKNAGPVSQTGNADS
jgi:hypothetical protein